MAPRAFDYNQRFVTISGVLATAVASPAGTWTVAYPAGYTQTSPWATSARLNINNNDNFTEESDKFDVAYGASEITITNKTGATLAAGTKFILEADLQDVVPFTGRTSTAASIPALTDSSGGTPADTIAAVPGSYTQATLAAQLASLTRQLNRIRTALVNAGIIV